jgi:GT2 family glycosyltransferase
VSLHGGADLSVIIVNYNVAPLVLQAVASLQRQKFAGRDGNEGHLEILVVDNASSPEDVARLHALPPQVLVVRNERNVGFAVANNQGIARASGRHLCFLNPDTKVLDGALDALLHHLYRHPDVGAVGPRIWADDDRVILLPPADPPTLSFILSGLVGGAVPSLARRHGLAWYRYATGFWRSRMPLSVTMLSGACIVTPRAVVDRVGGFDPRYFLYYEDADWCRRVRGRGLQLIHLPDAEIVHYYNQSAKPDPYGAGGHALRSRAHFVQVHYGRLGTLLYTVAQCLNSRRAGSGGGGVESRHVIDLGRLDAPPRFRAVDDAAPRELLVQISYSRLFVPSAAAFVRQAEFQLPPAVWERMQPGRYHTRMIDPETLSSIAFWSWEKA